MIFLPRIIVCLLWISCAASAERCVQQCSFCNCDNGENPCGEVSADSCEKYFYQDSVNITCHLNETFSTPNVNNIYFETRDGLLSRDDMTVLDDRTAVLQHTLSLSDKKRSIVCRYNGTSGKIGKIEFLYLDYRPQQVQNLSCEWLNLEKLSCKWEHPVPYNTHYLNVTFERRELNGKFRLCPAGTVTSCDENNVGYLKDVEFRINVTNTHNSKNVTETTLIVIYNARLKLGKPSPIRSFSALEVNRTEIMLSWLLFHGDYQFTIKSKSRHDQQLYIFEKNSTELKSAEQDYKEKNFSVTLTNLTVNTLYEFEITARYYDLMSDALCELHSDPVTMTTRTLEDVAKFPPKTTKGGYSQEIVKSTGLKNIAVYWQYFDAMEEYGLIVKYNATLVKWDGTVLATAVVPSTQQSYTFLNISADTSALVYIRSGTQVGFSENSTAIVISGGNLEPPTMLLEKINGSSYLVSWISSNQTNITGFTVYWCRKQSDCQNNINWMNVSATQSSYRVNGLTSEDYMFGVSMETHQASSGFDWGSCFYERNKAPTSSRIQVQSRDQSSITAFWIRPNCGELSPFIKLYYLYWCPAEDVNSCNSGETPMATVYSDISSVQLVYKIADLKPATRYIVWTVAESSAGLLSGEEIRFNFSTMATPENDSSITITVTVVMSVLTVVTVVFVILLYRYGWLKKVKEFLYPKIDIDNIEITPTIVEVPTRGLDNFVLESEDRNKPIVPNEVMEEKSDIKVNENGYLEEEDIPRQDIFPDADLSKSSDSLHCCEELLSLLPVELCSDNQGLATDLDNEEHLPQDTIPTPNDEHVCATEPVNCAEQISDEPKPNMNNDYLCEVDLKTEMSSSSPINSCSLPQNDTQVTLGLNKNDDYVDHTAFQTFEGDNLNTSGIGTCSSSQKLIVEARAKSLEKLLTCLPEEINSEPYQASSNSDLTVLSNTKPKSDYIPAGNLPPMQSIQSYCTLTSHTSSEVTLSS